jgi:ribosome biogenesis GTPase
VVDTPGLKEFGVWEATADELAAAFPDVARHAAGCRYQDCSHQIEPECAVRDAVEAGEIDPGRFASYQKILEEALEG